MHEQDGLNHRMWCKGRHVGLGVVTLIAALLAACGGGGGGSQPPTPTPTPGPTPVPSVAIEAAAGVATSTMVGLAALAYAEPVSGTGAGAASAADDGASAGVARVMALVQYFTIVPRPQGEGASTRVDGGAAATGSCPLGGTVDATCSESGGSTTLIETWHNCAVIEPTSDNTITGSGGVTLIVGALGVCTSGQFPTLAPLTMQMRNFSGTITTKPGGTLLEQFTATITMSFNPTIQGCAGPNGNETIDGSLSEQAEMGAIDIAVVAHQMALQVTSSGSPCAVQLGASGGLDIDDHAGGRRFYQTFTGLQATLTGSETTLTSGSLEGTVVNSCLGTVQFHTETPVQFPENSECPTAGALTVTRGDGTHGRIQFSTSGVGFDFNADGTVDMSVPSCAAAPQCSG